MRANAADIKEKVIFKELSYEVCGLCFRVHNDLGRFCNERQYADALEKLFKEYGIRYKREYILPESFEGERRGRNQVDFLIGESIILDLKAKTVISRDDYFQMKRYLTSANKKSGIIVNFRQKFLVPQRVINSNL